MRTIRSRLIIIFTVCLTFTGGLAFFYYQNIIALEKKLMLIEQFDDFRDNILELRRYEKNYFLTGKSMHLEQVDYYLSNTEKSFSLLGGEMKGVLDTQEYNQCAAALTQYRNILKHCDVSAGDGLVIEEDLRPIGKTLTTFSEKLINKKRVRIAKVLRQMLIIPIAFSAGFILLVIFVMHITREDILKPLSLVQKAAENTGKGVFKPITYKHRKENEVSQCIEAFNKMAMEIDSRQEQLLQSRKMASIGTFTSGIAHELNNPINNISLIVDSLLEDGEALSATERRDLYNDLMAQAERSSEIVKNLLEFSRTDQEHLETISMEEMVNKTGRLLKNEFKIKRIKFQTRIQEGLPKVWIDQSRLQQALLNLLLNSIQAMPDGGELIVAIESDPGSEEIRIDVKDTGIGIPKEQLDSIFDPFFTTKKEGEGTGLGLSVTYNIIRCHHGRIQVESTQGKGACFSIFLPVKA